MRMLLLLVAGALISVASALRVTSISPHYGSLEGGTKVLVKGDGFSTDTYSGANLVFIGTHPCIVDWYYTSSDRILCTTTRYPWGGEIDPWRYSPWLFTTVISNGARYSGRWGTHFQYNYWRSPLVRSIVPDAAPVGSLVEIGGQYFFNEENYHLYQHIYVGTQLCELRDPINNRYYGIEDRSGLRYIRCLMKEQLPGAYNASTFLSYDDRTSMAMDGGLLARGKSVNHSLSLKLDHTNRISMIELYPDIHSVSQHFGAANGGTLITIRGRGFGNDPALVAVDIDGTLCTVVSVTMDTLTCRTTTPPPDSRAVVNDVSDGANVTLDDVEDGYRFIGGRGVTLHQYLDITGSDLVHLYSADNFPDNPDRYSVNPSFQSEHPIRMDNYGERYMTFFTPLVTAPHSLFITSDDEGELLISDQPNITNVSRTNFVDSAISSNNWFYRRTIGEQRSEMMSLNASQSYLLIGHVKEGGGGDHFHVGYLLHNTGYRNNETYLSNRERQFVVMETEGLYNIQELVVVANWSATDENSPPTINITWGGRTSQPIAVNNITTVSVNETLEEMITGLCYYDNEVFHYDDNVFGFENASADGLSGWSSTTPGITTLNPYCGRRSLHITGGRALLTLDSSERLMTDEYPFFCFAYKIPQGVPVGIRLSLNGYSGCWSIPVIGHSDLTCGDNNMLHSFSSQSGGSIIDDDQWHYTCTNLHQLIASSINSNDSSFEVTEIGFYSDPNEVGYQIDEVSLSSDQRSIESYTAPAQPSGVSIDLVTISVTNVTYDVTNTTYVNITVTMEIVPASCDHVISPMISQVNMDINDAIEMTDVMVTQTGSEALTGVFTLSFNGHVTPAMPHDIPVHLLKETLEEYIPDIGTLSIWLNGPLSGDRYRKYCLGRSISIRFDSLPGDHPLLVVDDSQLSGTNLQVTVYEREPGGLFVRPIPGHQLRTVETRPQVHVTVNSVTASCSGDHEMFYLSATQLDPCYFIYGRDLNPMVTSITPATGNHGDTITIIGNKFSLVAMENIVKFGDVTCNVTSSTDTMITCTLEEGTVGQKPLSVEVLNYGIANVSDDLYLNYTIQLDHVMPASGSVAGGTDIVITGYGFIQGMPPCPAMSATSLCSDWIISVTVDNNNCPVSLATSNEVTCRTPMGSAGAVDVSVTATCCHDNSLQFTETLTAVYTYDANVTATVTSISPVGGSGAGGDTVTITGSGFVTIETDQSLVAVMIGDAECDITSITDTSITCVTSPHPPGVVDVLFVITDQGHSHSTAQYTYSMSVSGWSPCEGSWHGGQVVTITGSDLVASSGNYDDISISLGNSQCDVTMATPTGITCTTRPNTVTHNVDNNEYNEEYGLGYMWNPQHITVAVGDTIKWSWTGSTFGPMRNVAQVPSPDFLHYTGHGFRSPKATTGSYSYTFTHPGVYYYVSEGYGHIGFYGSVNVTTIESEFVPVTVKINGVHADITASCDPSTLTNCAVDSSHTPSAAGLHYKYSSCLTPVVQEVSPSYFGQGQSLTIRVLNMISSAPGHVIGIGGSPCVTSSVTTAAGIGGVSELSCDPPMLTPGVYSVRLHVTGQGEATAAANHSTVQYHPLISMVTSIGQGSLRGGTEISIPGLGFYSNSISYTQVFIGNTPCYVQHAIGTTIPGDLGNITCITGSAVDDGYSSLVLDNDPLGYWNMQSDHYTSDGMYLYSNISVFANLGSTGSNSNAISSSDGLITPSQTGISGNNISDQSIFINASHLYVPFNEHLNQLYGIGIEMWVRGMGNNGWGYQVVMTSHDPDVATGYLIMINPCGYWEVWLGSGDNDTTPSPGDCPLITTATQCTGYTTCNGRMVVLHDNSPYPPGGVWNIVRTMTQFDDTNTTWTHLVVNYVSDGGVANSDRTGLPSDTLVDDPADRTNCSTSSVTNRTSCMGTVEVFINGAMTGSASSVLYSPAISGNLLIGGIVLPWSNELLSHFVGFIDEVSLYATPLSSSVVANRHHYGNSDDQPIWVVVEGVADDVQELTHLQQITWDPISSSDVIIGNDTAVQVTWSSGYHGIAQVDKDAYESCDLQGGVVRHWAPPGGDGRVTIDLPSGQVYYFIDTVPGNCELGHKMNVKVGTEHMVNWRLGVTYNDITITVGTGVVFRWDGSVPHNLIEMTSRDAVTSCAFVGDNAAALGKVVREWLADPVHTGEVHVSQLSPGDHYFVCSVGGHCAAGMRVTVHVVGGVAASGSGSSDAAADGPITYTIPWRVQYYQPLTITDRDSLNFTWNGFHSLHQVTPSQYGSCDLTAPPLHEWGEPSVDNSVTISDLSPGVYYYYCSVSGHCDAGMKLQVTVVPYTPYHVIRQPVKGVCQSSRCSFSYRPDHTPYLISVQDDHVKSGDLLNISGHGLVDPGVSVGSLISDVSVWFGGVVPCTSLTYVSDNGGVQQLECTVGVAESGFYHVDVLVDGTGFAAVNPTPLQFGLIRNSSHPTNMLSPYPIVFIAAMVTSISPNTGSLAGGTALSIYGNGFSNVVTRNSVTIGGSPCIITSSNYTTISCITGSSSQERTVSLSGTVNGFPVSANVMYSYATMATPMITGTSVANSSTTQEDDWLVINGDRFTTDVSMVTVTILTSSDNDVECVVTMATVNMINCTLPGLPAGDYDVMVHVNGMGYALPSSPNVNTVRYAASIDSFTPIVIGFGGGVDISLFGVGFPLDSDDGAMVTICGVSCDLLATNLTHITCHLGRLPPDYTTMTTVSCDVVLSYLSATTTASNSFTYNNTLTPQLTMVTPNMGGTGGGTNITISGNNFLPPGTTNPSLLTPDDIIITIDTAVCEWHGVWLPGNTEITCRSSAHRTVIGANVNVLVKGRGSDGSRNTLYDYIDRWSSPYTWGGAAPPTDGESVHIRSGQTIILDEDTALLNLIVIEGNLIFEDEQNLHLQARYIFINNGRLQVGTEQSPFLHKATITLHGTIDDPEIPIYGAKVLAVRQGELDLHGHPRNITWVRLAATANQNSSSLSLQQPVDWLPGDQIVIASTTKDGNETEVNFVSSISDGGHTITLLHPLNYTHDGVTETYQDGHSIDIRAEVGLLTHNVVVQGSRLNTGRLDELGADQYGSQIMIHRMGPHPTPIRIEHTEVRFGGQAFRLGRYAIHFHLSGLMRGSYIRHCSIHHSNNRAITAHGVHELLIEGNVAYDVKGHMFFVEDGIETGNRYINNLGLVCRGSSSLLNTDQIPAVFWITNPNNTFIGNAAAASRAYGFWYDLDNHPSGASFTRSVCPNKTPLGTFNNNVAHTCNEFGFRIWETYTPFEDGCNGNTPSIAIFSNLVSYSNGIHGLELSVVGHVQLVGFKVADNRDNGMEIQETHGEWGGPLIKDSLIISHTSVSRNPAGTGGIKTPNTPYLTILNVTFVNFDLPGTACLRACSHCKVFQGGFQVWLEQLHFINSDQRKTAFQWEHEVLFWDFDGSLTGHIGGWATPTSRLHPPQYCDGSLVPFNVGSFPGSVCTSDVYFLRLAWNQVQPLNTFEDVPVNVTNQFGQSVVPWRHYRLTHLDGYMFTMPSGYPHQVVWDIDLEHRVDVTSYSAGVYAVRPEDYVMVTHEFVTTPDHIEVGGVYNSTGRPLLATDDLHSWYIDNSTNTTNVTYMLTGAHLSLNYTNILYGYSYEACPRSGCPTPRRDGGPVDADYRRWSDPDSWVNTTLGRAPVEGEDVVIESSWRMLVDISPPPLGKVEVLGEMKFEDERDYNFTAALVLVIGPNSKLVVGEEPSPFEHSVTITLTGVRGTPDFALSRRMNVGSKALGIFGNVSLIGQRRSTTWTRLANNASQGSNEIVVSGNVDWIVGDQIVIAPSEYEPDEAEVRTIINVSGRRITLDQDLDYDHMIHTFLDQSEWMGSHDPEDGNLNTQHWWGNGGQISPEVGLLSRNIVIQGGEDPSEPLEQHHYGCRVLIGRFADSYDDTHVGRAQIDSVEFRYCGQGGYFSPRDPRYSLAFKDLKEDGADSYVRSSSIHHGYNTAIGVHSSNSIELSGNVIYRTTDSSVKLGGVGNTLTNTLAILTSTIQPNSPRDNHAVDYPATFEIDRGQTVRNNAAGGSYRISYKFAGESCVGGNSAPIGDQANFWSNTAHTGLLALLVTGLPQDCTSVAGLTALHHYDYSIFSSTASPLVISHMILGVNKVGFNLNIFGPNPVQHFLGRKWIKIERSLIVGNVPGETCLTRAPSIVVPSSSFRVQAHKLGIMMSSFNQKRSKMDGTGSWHLMKGYPVIDGVVEATDLTFARFFNFTSCSYGVYAIGNNPLSPDAVHPMHFTGSTRINTDKASVALYYPPNPAWIVQEDCVDMDCDGPKHALVRDVDGTLLGSAPEESSIVPFAEIRFDEDRTPETWLGNAGPQDRYDPSDVIMARGVARGVNGNVSASGGGCVWVPTWQAYCCRGLQHHMMVIESMDADTETRRISPLAVVGGDTGPANYTDLMNGPMDHGWCTYYTCLKRLSTFFSLVAVGNTDYHIWMTGSLPGHMRLHLLNAEPADVIRLHIWYKNPQRKDVYRNGIYIEPKDVRYLPDGQAVRRPGDDYYPLFDDHSGANYFERDTQLLHLILKGSDPVEIRTPPVVQVSLDLAVGIDDFFESDQFVQYLAFVLRIDVAMIRVVDIVAEDTPLLRRRRSLLSSVNMTTIILEIGDSPQNGTAATIPPIEEDYNTYTNESVDLDSDQDADLTNGTGLPVEEDMAVVSDNPLNEDPPTSEEDFVSDYDQEVAQFTSDSEEYMMEVERVTEVNTIVETLVNSFQTNSLTVDNATIVGLSLIPAAAPAPPPSPVVPIDYSNTSVQVPEPLPLVNLSVVLDSETGSVTYSIPRDINIVVQPPTVSGHLVYVVVEITDGDGNRVVSLGIVNSWNCTAQLNTNSGAQLGGHYVVSFVNGVANFTRLRVDTPTTDLQLSFTISPGVLPDPTTVTFTVTAPAEDSPGKLITFKLAGNYRDVVMDYESFLVVVKEHLGQQLDIDVSRITRLRVYDGSIAIEVEILERFTTDPPDVPTLNDTLVLLQVLVDNEQFYVAYNQHTLYAEGGSYSDVTTRTASDDDDIDWVILGPIVGVAFGLVAGTIILILLCCYCKNRDKVSKSRTSSAHDIIVKNEFTMQSLSSSSTMGSHPSGTTRVSNINVMMDGGYGNPGYDYGNPTATTFTADMPNVPLEVEEYNTDRSTPVTRMSYTEVGEDYVQQNPLPNWSADSPITLPPRDYPTTLAGVSQATPTGYHLSGNLTSAQHRMRRTPPSFVTPHPATNKK